MLNKYFIDLTNYVPDYVSELPEMQALYYVEGLELGLLKSQIEDVLNQFNIDTATWGLRIYEDKYGIEYNPSLTDEERREIVKAARRGRGSVDVQTIKNTALAFECGEADVIRHDNDRYFEVVFISERGIPKNLDALKERLNIIKPAHLGTEYKFTYNTWADIINAFDSWEEVMDYFDNWKEVKDKTIKKAELAKRLHSIYYLDETTNSYKRITFK